MQNVSGEQYSEYIFKIFKYSYGAVEAASQSVSDLNIASSCQRKEVMPNPSFNDFQ